MMSSGSVQFVSGDEEMPASQYGATLGKDERKELTALFRKGTGSDRRIRRVRLLLMADKNQEGGGWKDADIAIALSVHLRAVELRRERCVMAGLELVMDNLNTHRPASLYEAFEPAEARRISERLEIHHIPKHGSWLNMAEIELSVLHRQCLNVRIYAQSVSQALIRYSRGRQENLL